MAGLDRETVERVARWCAEAGRTAGPAAVRAALEPLGWDELLLARALLADPPPGRPLGPFALADLARGTPLDQAVEREREGRYPAADGPADAEAAQAAAPAPPPRAGGPAAKASRLGPVLRKKAPATAPPPLAAPLPLLDELLLPAGRNTLERLMRRHGGRSAGLVGALAADHRRPDGQVVDRADLDRLLEHHGLRRAYLRRERDELLHAVRAAGGVLAAAATALGTDRDGLLAAATRLEVEREVEALRDARRRELGARATLSERARLLATEPARLGDLGLLETFEAELRARLPEHLKALGASREPLALALARSLSLEPEVVLALVARLGVSLDAPRPPPARRAGPPPRRALDHRGAAPGRPPSWRPSGRERPGSGTSGPRSAGARADPPRPGTRPPGPRRSPGRETGRPRGAKSPRRAPR